MGSENYKDGFKLSVHESALYLPLTWKKPQTIFVNSMSDLFHKDIPVNFLMRTFEVMNKADWHNFQVLTKRSDILLEVRSDNSVERKISGWVLVLRIKIMLIE